ncbi:MAG: hypothetical protein NC453_10245 [Muribaculum sp.]|nr:hypothetical protein [Muribaculum sp.]
MNKRQGLLINSGSILTVILTLFYFRYFSEDILVLSYLIGILSASALFVIGMSLFNKSKRNRLIEWLSMISFEIYLVHMFFLYRRGVYEVFDNILIGFIALAILSVAGGCILNMISNRLSSVIAKPRQTNPV